MMLARERRWYLFLVAGLSRHRWTLEKRETKETNYSSTTKSYHTSIKYLYFVTSGDESPSCPSYLEIIFFVDRQAVRKHIARNNHVGLVSVHGEPVHPQELRQQCVAMALHDKLSTERDREIKLKQKKINKWMDNSIHFHRGQVWCFSRRLDLQKVWICSRCFYSLRNKVRIHLMVFLQDVVHLSHVLAADGLDDVAFVARGVESGAAASLRLAVQRSAAGQWILQTDGEKLATKRSEDRLSERI